MIALSGERTLLLKLFARRVSACEDGITVFNLADLPSAEIVALFNDSPQRGELPHTIVVAKPQLREFFAWASTYLGHWSPLTSRVRVVRRVDLADLQIGAQEPRTISDSLCRGLMSLIVGEVLCEWALAGERSAPAMQSIRSTFGYAATRSLLLREHDIGSLPEAWERARRILHLAPRRIPISRLSDIWNTIAVCLYGGIKPASIDQELERLVDNLISFGRLPAPFHSFDGGLFSAANQNSPPMTREDSVIELQKWLSQKGSRVLERPFVTGCLGARLSSSALTHFDVLSDMTESDPGSLLWYSFASGMTATDPSTQPIERLFYRLSSDICPSGHAIQPDISLDELEVLTPADGVVPPWVGAGTGYLNVELKHGVCVTFRVNDRGIGKSTSAREGASTESGGGVFEDLLQRLLALYHEKNEPNQKRRRRK